MSEKSKISVTLKHKRAVIFDVQETLYSNGRLFSDTISFLEKLKKQGFLLAVLSNASKDYLDELLDGFKISKYFDCVLSARDYDTKKPDPMLIGVLVALLNDVSGDMLNKDDCVFIGDKPSTDIRCAKLSGIQSIRILRGVYANKIPDDEYEIADFEFKNFRDAETLFF
ncbi:HAD hydrolase-like protein [archaeon]|nr:HAD hydrolase-like protein [archaeon]